MPPSKFGGMTVKPSDDTLPRAVWAVPEVPGVVDMLKDCAICQHSRVDEPFRAPMAVTLRCSEATSCTQIEAWMKENSCMTFIVGWFFYTLFVCLDRHVSLVGFGKASEVCTYCCIAWLKQTTSLVGRWR